MSYASEVAADSPVMSWFFDDTSGTSATDGSGNSRVGVYTGTYSLAAAAVCGDGGASLDLSTSPGGYVIRSTTTGLPVNNFTHEIWAKRNGNAHDGNGSGFLMGRDSTSASFSTRSWYVYWNDTGTISFRGFVGGSQKFSLTSATISDDGHHIAVTWGSGVARIYIDGVEVVNSGSIGSASLNTTTQAHTVGRAAAQLSGGLRYFNGWVDNHHAYATELSAARIAAHYAAGVVTPVVVSGETFTATAAALSGTPIVSIVVPGEVAAPAMTVYDGTLLVGLRVDGETFTAAATALDGTPASGMTVVGSDLTVTATFLDGSPLVGLRVDGDQFTATTVAYDGTALVGITVAGDAAAVVATMLDGAVALGAIVVAGEAFTCTADMLDGTAEYVQNDLFAFAEPIILTDGEYLSSDVDASMTEQEDGETALPGFADAGAQSAWWTWTAATPYVATFDLLDSSDGPLLMQVYTGTEIDDLVLVASASGTVDDPLPVIADLVLEADETYYVYVVNRFPAIDETYVLHVAASPVVAGDDIDLPFGIFGTDGDTDLDLTGATVGSGETVPAGVTRTLWLAWEPDDEASLERFRLSNPDATLVVYDEGVEVASLDAPVDGRFQPEVGHEYLLQIGLPDAVDATMTIVWSDGTAPDNDEPEGADSLGEVYGSTDVSTENATAEVLDPPGATTQTVWLRVDPEEDGTVEYTFTRTSGDGEWGVTTHDEDLTETSEALTSGDTLTVTLDLVTGTPVLMQVGSGGDAGFRVVWNQQPELIDPEPPDENLVVKVYQPDGLTFITEVPRRFGCSGQDPLNSVGVGTLSVQMPDSLLGANAYPNLFDYRNIVKFWLGGKCIGGFRIRRRRTVYVTTDEWAGYVRTVSGPTLLNMLDDFMVMHDGKRRKDSSNERYYGWASIADEWYNASDWDHPIASSSLRNPPGDWSKPVKQRAKWGNPYRWKDRGARWLYAPDGVNAHGKKYVRKTFTLRRKQHVRIMASGDEQIVVYLDSDKVIEVENVETGYTSYQKYDCVLPKGQHTIAVFARGVSSAGGDGNDSMLWSVMKVNTKGKVTDVIVHSNENVKVWYGPKVPCWNRAMVLRSLVNEAKARGIPAAQRLTLGFTKTTDSYGLKWTDRFDDSITVGRTTLDVTAQLTEHGGFDAWVDNATMVLEAARRRGRDKSASVTLEPGRNLIDWSVDEVDEVKNDFLIQYDGGWARYVDAASVNTYDRREAYVSLGNSKDDDAAILLMRRVALGVAAAVQRSGGVEERSRRAEEPAGSLIAVNGARPFLDFETGDTVKAPNADGVLKPHRVMALSFTEDEMRRLSYDPDMEEVR